jgi:pimeloyl-ACP methyl ester carboxylesterase
MPVLVVTGDDDRIVPTADSVRLAGEIPGARLVVFERCGHVPQEECSQAFLEAVAPFIGETYPGTAARINGFYTGIRRNVLPG